MRCFLHLLLIVLASACSDGDPDGGAGTGGTGTGGSGGSAGTGEGGNRAPDECGSTTNNGGSTGFYCRYDDPYSGHPECRAYFGVWTAEEATSDCNSIFRGVTGTVNSDPCAMDGAFGCCTIAAAEGKTHVTLYYDGDKEMTVSVCEGLLAGTWQGDRS